GTSRRRRPSMRGTGATTGAVQRSARLARPAVLTGLVALVALGVGVLIAEGVSRVREGLQCDAQTAGFFVRDVFYRWRHVPRAEGWAKRCLGDRREWQVYTRINALGLRDRDIPYAHGDAFRILVLGDSFTDAMQIDQERIYTKLLERRLNPGAPPG